jgi:hypothetical protein
MQFLWKYLQFIQWETQKFKAHSQVFKVMAVCVSFLSHSIRCTYCSITVYLTTILIITWQNMKQNQE